MHWIVLTFLIVLMTPYVWRWRRDRQLAKAEPWYARYDRRAKWKHNYRLQKKTQAWRRIGITYWEWRL